MKEKFKSFYQLSEEELRTIWSDNNTVFIFDTNILLNLYQYSEETREEFFNVLEEINDRIWIPFHVALEYQRRRLDIIKKEKKVFDDIYKKLDELKKILDTDFSSFKLKDRNPTLNKKKEKFEKNVYALVEQFKADVEIEDNMQPCVRSDDKIRLRLDEIFKNKVGEEPEDEFLNRIYEEGKDRYEKKIPPGYEDNDKGKNPDEASFLFNGIEYHRKFGDLIIWKQIIEHSKASDNLKNVVFITDDSKKDWWELINSRGNKVIGAQPELKNEIYREAKINNFQMYHTNDFLIDAKKYCSISVDDKTIDEATEHLNYYNQQISNSSVSLSTDPYFTNTSSGGLNPLITNPNLDALKSVSEKFASLNTDSNLDALKSVSERFASLNTNSNLDALRSISERLASLNNNPNLKAMRSISDSLTSIEEVFKDCLPKASVM